MQYRLSEFFQGRSLLLPTSVLNAVKFLGWLKEFGPALNILGPVKGQEDLTYKQLKSLPKLIVAKSINVQIRSFGN